MAGLKRNYTPVTKIGLAGSEEVTFDDLQVQITGVRLLGNSDPSWESVTLDGITVDLLTFDTDNEIELFVQTNHSVKLNTLIESHIHWTIGSGDSDDNYMSFQITGVGSSIGGAFTSIGTIKSDDMLVNSATEQKHNYMNIGDIPATFNSSVSTIFILKLKRVAPILTDSTANISIVFTDCHVSKDTFGSLKEDSKI